MNLFDYDKRKLGKQARELGFIRDTLEKVFRLSEILKYINSDPLLRESLALKGGTAINMTIFNLPRLSVDIDLDYTHNDSREKMFEERQKISDSVLKYMAMSGYELSPKSKSYHSLDSYVFSYANTAGMKDNIKVEINYSLRSHILPLEQRSIETLGILDSFKVNSLASIEIFASKIVALLTRAAARDLYDINNMIYFGLFDETELPLLKKCAIFYYAVGGEAVSETFNLEKIDELTEYKIRTDLYPVIRKKERFDLTASKQRVIGYLAMFSELDDNEAEFLRAFKNGEYHP
ncbi:MAG TPA: nucleotidyl transferase AbiEii/AbiGii toxin family protein, partial [Paludibacter sp.]|nr:nucleotidyl transferase AbiEii/AbiGii toxin family protein [Paludibacter sp.]